MVYLKLGKVEVRVVSARHQDGKVVRYQRILRFASGHSSADSHPNVETYRGSSLVHGDVDPGHPSPSTDVNQDTGDRSPTPNCSRGSR